MAKIKEGLGERSTKLHKRPRCRRAALVKMWVGTTGVGQSATQRIQAAAMRTGTRGGVRAALVFTRLCLYEVELLAESEAELVSQG